MDQAACLRVLGLKSGKTTPTTEELLHAYRKQALVWHPDLMSSTDSEHAEEATKRAKKFREITDAYLYLMELTAPTSSKSTQPPGSSSQDPYAVFLSAVEPLLPPQSAAAPRRRGCCGCPVWACLGAFAGLLLGFIVANVIGALLGAYGGYLLGRVRDQHGKSVAQVYQELPQREKMLVLRQLAAKLLVSL